MIDRIKYLFVKKIYANHNDSKSVKLAIREVLGNIPDGGVGLNIGSGKTTIDPRVKNMEIFDGPGIDYVGSVEKIPAGNEEFDVIFSQEVLEHVFDPALALKEMFRVLKPGGLLYIQLPFTIGYHPCPHDYWRFTKEGIVALVASTDLKVRDIGVTVGPATGFYRIAVEFFAILLSLIFPSAYKVLKAAFSILLYPIKYLDRLMKLSEQSDRIAGGYYLICEK